jgi:hypothetical protein
LISKILRKEGKIAWLWCSKKGIICKPPSINVKSCEEHVLTQSWLWSSIDCRLHSPAYVLHQSKSLDLRNPRIDQSTTVWLFVLTRQYHDNYLTIYQTILIPDSVRRYMDHLLLLWLILSHKSDHS